MIGNRYGILRRGGVWYNSVGRGRDGPEMPRGCEAPKGEPKTEDGPEIDSRRRRRLEVLIAFLTGEGEPNASLAGAAGDPKIDASRQRAESRGGLGGSTGDQRGRSSAASCSGSLPDGMAIGIAAPVGGVVHERLFEESDVLV